MKKKEKILIGILLILLVIVGSIYINVKNTNRGNVIQKQEISKGQLTENTGENAYVSTESHLEEVNAQDQALTNLNTQISRTTVTADRLLKGYTAYKNGQIITGTMENRGAVSQTLNAGGSYTIPAGFHNGSGKITATDLASQTQATATADNISEGKTAWVNGKVITGTMENRGVLNWNPSSSTTYIVQPGYYEGGTLNSANAYNAGYNNGKKVYNLGIGSQFDVSGYSGYQNFTVNNFIVEVVSVSTSGSAADNLRGNLSMSTKTTNVTKTYANGILTVNFSHSNSASNSNDSGLGFWMSVSANISARVWLVI